MKVKFRKTVPYSYDGVNERTYFEGQVYEATHAQEMRAFKNAVGAGDAEVYGEGARVETKVVTPVERKAVETTEAKPKTKRK